MKLKNIFISSITFLALAACGGESSNPDTASRDDLQSPKDLLSVTGDSKIELRWTGFNAEKELRGYHVFGAATTLADLASKVTYPKTYSVSELADAAIPRCEGNSAFFEAFGLPASDAKCEDDTATESGTEEEFRLTQEEEEEGATENADEPLTSKLSCADADSTNVSLPAEAPSLGRLSCTLTKVKDAAGAEVAIENGTTYVFFVVAVMGDEFNEISWTSNIIEDIPSKTVMDDMELTLKANTGSNNAEYVPVTIASDLAAIETAPAAAACGTSTARDHFCRLSTENSASDTGNIIYIGRDNFSASNQQRLFISAPSAGKIKLQPRRRAARQSDLPGGGTDKVRLPGDMATDSYGAKSKFQILGDQVFDIEYTVGSQKYYGKIVITDVNYADAADKTSEVTLKATIVFQTAAGKRYYFK